MTNLETIAAKAEPLRIACAQIWGGILAVDMDLSTAGLSASLFSTAHDGDRLLSDELERTIDKLSTSIPGFFVGRYDVRYASEEGLRMGKDFKIVELNGASAEPNIYDPKNSLRSAYRTMFRHWEIIFAIADENRRRGVPCTSLQTIWQNWLRYQQRSADYPVSD